MLLSHLHDRKKYKREHCLYCQARKRLYFENALGQCGHIVLYLAGGGPSCIVFLPQPARFSHILLGFLTAGRNRKDICSRRTLP